MATTFPYAIDSYTELTNYSSDSAPGDTIKAATMNQMLASAEALKAELNGAPTNYLAGNIKVSAVVFNVSNLAPISFSGGVSYCCQVPASVVSYLGSAMFTTDASKLVTLVSARPKDSTLEEVWNTSVIPVQSFIYWWSGAKLYVQWPVTSDFRVANEDATFSFYISVILIAG